MPALSEYATLSSHRVPLRVPQNLGEAFRWAVVLVAAFLAIRLLAAILRGFRS